MATFDDDLGERRGTYFSNADKSFDPSLVLLTFEGKDVKSLFFLVLQKLKNTQTRINFSR